MRGGSPIDVASASLEQLRAWCFDEGACGWGIRRIAWLVRKHVPAGSRLDRQDLFQETCARALDRFPHIVQSFQEDNHREHTLPNFERWLHVALHRIVIDAIRSDRRGSGGVQFDGVRDGLPPESQPDRERQQMLKAWQAGAISSLTPLQQQVLYGRFMANRKPVEIAAELGLSPPKVYNLIYEAKLRFRGELWRAVVCHYLARRPDLSQAVQPLVEARCTAGHPCYLYRLDCPKARTPADLTARLSCTPEEIARQLAQFVATVQNVLDDWSLGNGMDVCAWA